MPSSASMLCMARRTSSSSRDTAFTARLAAAAGRSRPGGLHARESAGCPACSAADSAASALRGRAHSRQKCPWTLSMPLP